MATLGIHCSHEQIPPSQLLDDVRHAEAAGFGAAMCSDHLAPWTSAQGESGNAWTWLGAALASTTLPFGVVTAPGQRYHPAVHTQAVATLAEMFPGRFWAALGSGEAVNEHVTGDRWPRKEVRDQRLVECVDVARRLLAGEEVSHDGLVTVDRARVWSRPPSAPLLLGAAVTPATAGRHARWADGLITVNQAHDTLAEVVRAYRGAGGAGELLLQVHLSWAGSDDEALEIAMDQWAGNVVGPPLAWDTDSVEGFDMVAGLAREEQLRSAVRVSADLDEHVEWLREYLALGFDGLYLHFVGKDQSRFIDAFAAHVLPALASGPSDAASRGTTAHPVEA